MQQMQNHLTTHYAQRVDDIVKGGVLSICNNPQLVVGIKAQSDVSVVTRIHILSAGDEEIRIGRRLSHFSSKERETASAYELLTLVGSLTINNYHEGMAYNNPNLRIEVDE